MGDKLDAIFDSFENNNLFKNKTVLQSNYDPDSIGHRDEQIELIASILAPALRGEKVSNLFVYGKTGTGKTLSIKHVANKMTSRLKKSDEDSLKFVYVNCKLKKVADTEYRMLAEIISELGGDVPSTGLPTDQVYKRFVDIVDNKKQMVILVLDEIDQAVKKISEEQFLKELIEARQCILKEAVKYEDLTLHDIQNIFCEFSKYMKVKDGLGTPKQIYKPTKEF